MKTSKDFIASKGWLDKFKVRYNLDIDKEIAAPVATSSGGGTVIGSGIDET